MTERESIRRALEHLHASDSTLEEVLDMIDREQAVKHIKRTGKNTLRTVLIAAVLTALLATTAFAAVVLARGRLEITETVVETPAGSEGAQTPGGSETENPLVYSENAQDGVKHYDITFKPLDDEYIEVGYWYPEMIPAGYEEAFVSDHQWQIGQRIVWEAEGTDFREGVGDYIDFDYFIAGDWYWSCLDGDFQVEEVTVGEYTGTLFTSASEGRSVLFWAIPERGIGFSLHTPGDVDILAIAESVKEQDEARPSSWAETTEEALAELGVYMPALPEGYKLTETHASPVSLGGGYYAYVRRMFENEEHAQIYLGYEMIGHPSDPSEYSEAELYGMTDEEIAQMIQEEYTLEKHLFNPRWLTEDYAVTDITIWGVPAAVVERLDGSMPLEVSWYVKGAGPQEGLLFVMWATDLTADELVALAESVTLRQ